MFSRGKPARYQWIPVAKIMEPQVDLLRHPSGTVLHTGTVPHIGAVLQLTEAVQSEAASDAFMSRDEALATQGLPQGVGRTPDQELVDLLRVAAEIEHGLMLQYLYAAYSSTNTTIAGLVKDIAVEEMGHFMTVQNLLLAAGEVPHLGPANWADLSEFRPFPFRLEPASAGSISKYTIAEMPDFKSPVITNDQRNDLLPVIIKHARDSAGQDVRKHRVGLLYMKIYWLLRANDAELPDSAREPWLGFPVTDVAATPGLSGRHVGDGFLTDKSAREGQKPQWQMQRPSVIIDTITGRDDALRAIAQISAQGEGFSASDNSHFDRFLLAWQQTNTPGQIAVKAAVDPWYTPGPDGGGPPDGEIKSKAGILFARLADGLYELCLLTTAFFFALPATASADIRAQVAKAALTGMKAGLGLAATSLRRIPLHADGADGFVCGPPFSIPGSATATDATALKDRARAVKDDVAKWAKAVSDDLETIDSLKNNAKSISEAANTIWRVFGTVVV